MPAFGCGTKRITPSLFQVPPRLLGASEIVTGGSPEIAIFFSFPCAKNPMDLLSGDQKAAFAPSVPGSGCAVSELIGRTQSSDLFSLKATKARRRPSGEITGSVTLVAFSGGETVRRMVSRSVAGRRK